MFRNALLVLSVVLMAVSSVWASSVVRVDLSQSGDVEPGWIRLEHQRRPAGQR